MRGESRGILGERNDNPVVREAARPEGRPYTCEGQIVGRVATPTTSIAAGTKVKSRRQGISLSVPVNPVRGSLTFSYHGAGADTARTTDPYVFICR